jgi:ABC-2 type transport system permease protein
MATLLALAFKDLRVLIANKGNVFWVFGFPSLFALLFGAIYSGAGEGPSGMKLAVVDEDKSEMSEKYTAHLESEEALDVERMERDDALDCVRKGDLAAAVVIGQGFGDGFGALFDADDPKLQIASDPGRRMEAGYLEGLLAKAQFEVMAARFQDRPWMQQQMGTWRSEIASDGGIDPNDARVYLRFFDAMDSFLQDVNERDYNQGLGDGMLSVARLDVQRESNMPKTGFQITFPQAIIWAILSCAATFAVSIVRERTTGTFQRLRVGPISQAQILAGKGLACFATCAFVACMLTLGGRLIFKVPIGSPVLFLIATACAALCFVGLMMFVSTLGKTEQSVGGAGWAMLMIMAMFGGAMMPLAFMPPWMQGLGSFSPVKWSVLAMEGAIWRDFSAGEMLLPCGVLILFGVAFFLLGVLMLRRVEL